MFLKKIMKNPYFILFVSIIFTGIIIYFPFIFGDYIFAYGDWGYDTKHSYLPGIEFYANRISEQRYGSYDFSFGLGSSIFANISFLSDIFGSILIFICSIVGADKVGFLLIFIHFFKNIIIGIIAFYYLKLFNFSDKSCLLTSYVCAFCGYLMTTGQHYQFATYAVLYLFGIVMTEKAIRGKKFMKFVSLSVFLLGINSPYVIFQSLIAMSVYSLVRVIQINKKGQFFPAIYLLLSLAGYMVLGLLTSMVILLPQIYEILVVSNRISSSNNVRDLLKSSFSLIPQNYIKTGIGRLFSNNLEGTINDWEGAGVYFSSTPYYFSIFFPICIVHGIKKIFIPNQNNKHKIIRGVITVFLLYSFFFGGIPLLSNMFAYIQYRYVYVLLPVFSYIMAECLDDLFIGKSWNISLCFNTVFCSVVLLLFSFNSLNQYSRISLKIVIILLIILFISLFGLSKTRNKQTLQKIFLVIFTSSISLSIISDAFITLYANRIIMQKNEYSTSYRMPYLKYFTEVIEKLEDDNFVRCDRTFLGFDGSPDVMIASIIPIRSVSVYNSTLSKYTINFFDKILGQEIVTQMSYSLNNYGDFFDQEIASLLGLKYIITDKETDLTGWNLVSNYDDFYLYQNQFITTAGKVYGNYITEEAFEQLNVTEKKEALSKYVILHNFINSNNNLKYKNENNNSSVNFKNPKMGNEVIGTIASDKGGILFMPIVYDKNWQAYINHQKVNVLEANYGFMAIEIPSGKIEVTFKYVNRSFYLGLLLSIFGISILFWLMWKNYMKIVS